MTSDEWKNRIFNEEILHFFEIFLLFFSRNKQGDCQETRTWPWTSEKHYRALKKHQTGILNSSTNWSIMDVAKPQERDLIIGDSASLMYLLDTNILLEHISSLIIYHPFFYSERKHTYFEVQDNLHGSWRNIR